MTTTRPEYLMDDDIAAATERFEVHPVLARHGSWVETTIGIQCLERFYWIEYKGLNEIDWVKHMSWKGWVKLGDFARALEAGRRRYGVMQRKAVDSEIALAA